jgi:hypothetical protein
VREVIHNEIESQLRDNSLWCYREQRQEDGKADKTLQVCQTKDGDLDRLVAVNGRELSPSEREAEDERIQKLISHPEQLRAKQKKEREEAQPSRGFPRSLSLSERTRGRKPRHLVVPGKPRFSTFHARIAGFPSHGGNVWMQPA